MAAALPRTVSDTHSRVIQEFATVETVLDRLPRVYAPQIYEQKCEQVYQHVFDSYTGLSGGIYANQ